MNKQQKKNYSYIIFIVLMYLLVFQNVIQQYLSLFKYFDEMLAITSILIILPIKIIKKDRMIIKKDSFIMMILIIIILCSGLYSNAKYKFQNSFAILGDIILILKFWGVYGLSRTIFCYNDLKENKDKIIKNVQFITYVFFILTICNYCFKIWPSSSVRYGIMANKLFYDAPTTLAGVCVFLISLATLIDIRRMKKEYILQLIVLVTTLRIKAIGAAVIVTLLILYVKKNSKRISISKLLIMGIILMIVAMDSITFYFLEVEDSARNMLLMKSIQISRDYFPVGTGFATFGSYMSSVHYSIVYSKYGINNIYGLSKQKPFFISDNFWPMILGQFGVIGIIAYIYLIVIMYKRIQREFSKENIDIYISKMICLLYIIISSTSEAAFVHPIAIPLAIIIGIGISKKGVK